MRDDPRNSGTWYLKNKEEYSKDSIVETYIGASYIDPCEEWFIETFRAKLGTWDMLDIGVGTGRTTLHFSPLVRSYTGVDYSPAMIAECKKRFHESGNQLDFKVCDMSDLSDFENDTFDFILISFNAISTLPLSRR